MLDNPNKQQVSINPVDGDDYSWQRVAQEMHTWHPGLQEHVRRHLDKRGLLHLVASTDLQTSGQHHTSTHTISPVESQIDKGDERRIRPVIRPTIESNGSSTLETKIISGPEEIPIQDSLTDEMKQVTAEEFVLGHDIETDSMISVDLVADQLYGYCTEIMSEGSRLRKYALATFISRGLAYTYLNDANIFLITNAPVIAEAEGYDPSKFMSWSNISETLEKALDINPDDNDYWKQFEDEVGASFDSEEEIANRLHKELVKDTEGDYYLESELGAEFEYGDETAGRDTLDMLTVLECDKGNKYYKRLLLRIFVEAFRDVQSEDIVRLYEKAKSQIYQKVVEGVIPSSFGDKLRVYSPKEFVFEDKMTAILNGREHWAGYYQGEIGRFAIVEDYDQLLPDTEDQDESIYFREPGTEHQYQDTNDQNLMVAIHELFHHLSGHSYIVMDGKLDTRKVGLSTDTRGRLINEAITERLAGLVYPQGEQSYGAERAILHALQINSAGLVTDELLYDAYLEEREEGGLPKFKKFIKTVGEAYGQKGFMQQLDVLFEDKGYQAAIEYLRKATQACGRTFKEPIIQTPNE